jgi:hypothetical protein
MRKNAYSNSEHTQQHTQVPSGGSMTAGELPNRLMTAFEVAEFVGCREETIRRAYWRGLLTSQRFGGEEGGFVRRMSSTGLTEVHQP